MKKIAYETVGCRLNQYETEKIAAQMAALGFGRVAFDETADLYIINTCTVTGRADATCRNIISRAARRDGHGPIVALGCYVDSCPQKVNGLTGVDLVIGNKNKENTVSILRNHYPALFEGASGSEPVNHINEFYEHNRAWLKIGDGCNQRCAYCIIPLVRGPLTSRPPGQLVDEINALAAGGYNEVVLTGVHIGRYSSESVRSPADLVRYLLNRTDISRIRLSSIEPPEVDEPLIAAIAEGGPRVCRHLHIPLQSGSDRILRAMHRPYKSADYLDLVARLRQVIPEVIVGADIIVGFPGETDDDFERSVAVARSDYIDYLHVFSYSDRPGTEASEIPEKINPEIIKERNRILRQVSGQHYARALKRSVGQTASVISEHRSNKKGAYWGISDNYLKVLLPPGIGGGREIIPMQLTEATDRYLIGQPLP